MLTYLVAFLVALLVAAVATPLVTRFAHRHRLLDLPSEARKIHARAVPRIGGVAVALAFFAPIAGLAIYTNRISGMLYADRSLVTALFAGAACVLALGLYDDIRGASPKLKLAVQAGVALMMWGAGFRIELFSNPMGPSFSVGIWSLPLTVLWIVGVINALNLIDGLDGLASGIALFAALVLFGVARVDNAVLLCLLTAALGGSLLGFLFFNFNPARIFLGDSGSMFLGFILSTISIWTQRKGATAVALLIPVIALGVPILDTTLSFVRRVGKRQSPFKADREHVHHRLLALGLSHRSAVMTLYSVSAVFALGALALLDNDTTHRSIALSTVVATVILVVRKIGVFRLPGSAGRLDPAARAMREDVRRAARQIRAAADPELAWHALKEIAPRLECDEIRLSFLMDADSSDQRELVYRWRVNDRRGEDLPWELEGPQGQGVRALRFVLEEGGERLGELAVLERGSSGSNAERHFLFELFREALVDFRLARAELVPSSAGQIVRLPLSAEERASRTHLRPL